MKKELKSGILSADKSADCRPTVGGVNVIAVLRPLIDLKISFPLNILRTKGQNLTKFCIHINIDSI